MHAIEIEIETEIDQYNEIHLKLPAKVKASRARVVVLYEDAPEPDAGRKPVRLGLFRGQIRASDDFDAPLADEL